MRQRIDLDVALDVVDRLQTGECVGAGDVQAIVRAQDIAAGTTGPNNMDFFNAALCDAPATCTPSVSRFNFIVPNECEDGHTNCKPAGNEVHQFDDFLQREVPQILASPAFGSNGVLIITFDEGTINSPNHADKFGQGGNVAFGDGLYVAVGNSRPLASPDGESWTASLSGTSFSTVTYGNGMFVAAGGYIYISTNGSIWKLSSSAGFETYLTSAAYGNGQFVAAASGMYPGLSTFYFSTNGVVVVS